MTQVIDILTNLDSLAPFRYAEDWDNVGLLIGRKDAEVSGIATSVELTPEFIEFALQKKANVLVTHHPIFFRSCKKLIRSNRYDDAYFAYELIKNNLNHITLHTNFDRAPNALHSYLFNKLNIKDVSPLEVLPEKILQEQHRMLGFGYGVKGYLPEPASFSQFWPHLKQVFEIENARFVGDPNRVLKKIAFVSGSGMFLYEKAYSQNIDLYISGDLKYHEAMLAKYDSMAVVDVGHFGAEKHFAVVLEEWLKKFYTGDTWVFTGHDPYTTV